MKTLALAFLAVAAFGCDKKEKVIIDYDMAPNMCPDAQPKNGDACDFTNFCYYLDACTQDGMGVIASCTDGKVELAYDLPLVRCGNTAPKEGDPCPCVEGGRQELPCSYTCMEGGTRTMTCDPSTKKWTVSSSPATCTPTPNDGGV